MGFFFVGLFFVEKATILGLVGNSTGDLDNCREALTFVFGFKTIPVSAPSTVRQNGTLSTFRGSTHVPKHIKHDVSNMT